MSRKAIGRNNAVYKSTHVFYESPIVTDTYFEVLKIVRALFLYKDVALPVYDISFRR